MSMTTEEEIAILLSRVAVLQEKAKRQERFNILYDLPDGEILSFKYAFTAHGTVYDYAVIKVRDDRWFATGLTTKAYSTDEFIEWLDKGYVTSMYRMTRNRSVPEIV